MKTKNKVIALVLGFGSLLITATFFPIFNSAKQVKEIPRWLINDIILAESSFRPHAVGKAGERGLFQIKHDTWVWLTHRLYEKPLSFDLAFDPKINKTVGVYYLEWLKDQLGIHYSPASPSFFSGGMTRSGGAEGSF